MIFIYIILAVIVLMPVIIVLITIRRQHYVKFIEVNSVALSNLRELNSRYNFYQNANFDMEHTFDNKNFFDEISCRDYLTYQMQFKQREILSQISRIRRNERDYKNYKKEVDSIKKFGEYKESCEKLKIKKLIELEKEIYCINVLRPTIKFQLIVTLRCSKIDGSVYAKKRETFTDDVITDICKILNKKRGTFYLDREIWNSICRVERGRVSNKMRFAVYKRDGYRCRICGATEREDALEVDHIIPIAKGGKSTFDNLQTLCHRCNVAKGDSLPDNYYSGKR